MRKTKRGRRTAPGRLSNAQLRHLAGRVAATMARFADDEQRPDLRVSPTDLTPHLRRLVTAATRHTNHNDTLSTAQADRIIAMARSTHVLGRAAYVSPFSGRPLLSLLAQPDLQDHPYMLPVAVPEDGPLDGQRRLNALLDSTPPPFILVDTPGQER